MNQPSFMEVLRQRKEAAAQAAAQSQTQKQQQPPQSQQMTQSPVQTIQDVEPIEEIQPQQLSQSNQLPKVIQQIVRQKQQTPIVDDTTELLQQNLINDEEVLLYLKVMRGEKKFNILSQLSQ